MSYLLLQQRAIVLILMDAGRSEGKLVTFASGILQAGIRTLSKRADNATTQESLFARSF